MTTTPFTVKISAVVGTVLVTEVVVIQAGLKHGIKGNNLYVHGTY